MPSQEIITPPLTKNQSILDLCALCNFPISSKKISANDKHFCCHGCHLVYQILEAKNALSEKNSHPLLQQAMQFGLISNPELIEKIARQNELKKITSETWIIEIGEMWCPFCAELIHLAIGARQGVYSCSVDYVTDLAQVIFDPCQVSKETIALWIKSLGYKVTLLQDTQEKKVEKSLIYRFAFAGFSAMNVMMLTYPLYATYLEVDMEGMQPLLAFISLLLTVPTMAYSGYPIYRRIWQQLRCSRMGMETLVGLGTGSAFILSVMEMAKGSYHVYFDTITTLIAFLLLGKMIESKAKFSTKSVLMGLYRALPRKGRKVFGNGDYHFVAIKDIIQGDLVAAFTGERVVLDGVLEQGEGFCDESLITGEVTPVRKTTGAKVIAGSIVQSGSLIYKVTSEEGKSTLNKILSLVQFEVGKKNIFLSNLERWVLGFTPCVLALAILTALVCIAWGFSWDESISRALATVMIACPCAIGIALPLVESKLLSAFAAKGAIVRNLRVFTLLPKITHFIFDKTGTLTQGRLTPSGLEDIFDKAILKGLALQSHHPVSKAISQAINVHAAPMNLVQEVIGMGLSGFYEGKEYSLGSYKYLMEKGGCVKEDSASVYFFSEGKILGKIFVKDEVRSDAKEMLCAIDPAKKILLSGDKKTAVQKLAAKLGFTEWYGEKSPLEKQQFIAHLQKNGACVAMTGDGINDSPAFATADVAISFVSASDISIQVSDLLLMKQELMLIPTLQKLAKQGSAIAYQNLFWAFAYNFFGIALAILGFLTPLFASFAMILSSLMVILNAQRVKIN